MLKLAKKMNKENGQALLIVVLVMVVALTVTLSLVSRSVVNLKTSVDQANSQRALAAAEAGIEQKIQNSSAAATGSLGVANYTTSVDTLQASNGSQNFLVYGGNTVPKNQGAYIWLSPHDSNNNLDNSVTWSGNLTIYWGDNSGAQNNAALEVAVISGSSVGNSVITRYAVDPYSSRGNSFSAATSVVKPINGTTFYYSYTINGITSGRIVRVLPIYKSTAIGAYVSTLNNFPIQGEIITATASAGSVQRKVTVFQGYPELPAELFPYTILSEP